VKGETREIVGAALGWSGLHVLARKEGHRSGSRDRGDAPLATRSRSCPSQPRTHPACPCP
jgi:hypothetical protein